MSSTRAEQSPARPRSRGPRLRWIIAAAAFLVAVPVGLYVYLQYAFERELREAIAEADRPDTGWRFEEMEAARPAVPDAENGAALVLAAHGLMPANWLAPPANGATPLYARLADMTPAQRPIDEDLNELRAELAKVGAALDKARELADRPRGRYTVVWNEDLIGTLVPHLDSVRQVVSMLTLDALLRSWDGDHDGAVRSCQAALNAGRSVGDEPMGVSQLVRAAAAAAVVRALERVLATGTASPKSLEEMQRLLTQEAAAPSLLIAMRGARVCYHQPLDLMRTGRFNRDVYKMMPSMLGSTGDELIDRRLAQACEAAYVRYGPAMVEIAKLPTEVQEEHFAALVEPDQKLPRLLYGLTGGSQGAKLARSFQRTQAMLRSAAAALAAERYRLAEERWPDSLDALVPRYLPVVPIDPYDGRPLRMRRLADGLAVYSVGPDRTDDGGKLDQDRPGNAGTDVGFQLWDGGR